MPPPKPPFSPVPFDNIVVWGGDTNQQVSQRPHGIFTKIARGGATQALALRSDGIPVLWGTGGQSQIALSPIKAGAQYIDVAIGLSVAGGIRADQGIDILGGTFTDANKTPATLPSIYSNRKFQALAFGGQNAVAIDTNGQLVEWGPAGGPPPNPGKKFLNVCARSGSSMALDEDGAIYGWGPGLLFSPSASSLLAQPWQWTPGYWSARPVLWHPGYWVHPGPFRAIAVGAPVPAGATGVAHALALRRDGHVESWGNDTNSVVSTTPKRSRFIDIAAGSGFSVALHTDGQPRCWGKLDGTATPTGSVFTGIAAGVRHAAGWWVV